LNLVGIQDSTKDNMDLSLVRGNITETQLEESHDSSYYDLSVSYSLPIKIGNVDQKINNFLADTFNDIGEYLGDSDNSLISTVGNWITDSNGVKSNVTDIDANNGNTLQPNTDSQSIINVGDWSNSWKNTTVTYKDDNGFDFTASPASTYYSVVISGTAAKYAATGIEETAEFAREHLEDKTIVGKVASQPFSAVEGFFDYFVENDSYIVLNGEKIYNPTEEQLQEAKNYYANGINNVEDDLDRYSIDNPDTVIRYNPTSGVTGDVIECALGKLFNWNGLTAQLGSMNRIVANDLIIRQDNQDSINKFHSQGTIIGTGAMSILSWKGIELDDSQTMKAVGPAVYETMWDYKADQIANNVQYIHDENDGVRNVTAPRSPVYVFAGLWDLITNMDKHNVSNPKYN